MTDTAEFDQHPVFLSFISSSREKKYRSYTNEKHRVFYLGGIVLSTLGWLLLVGTSYIAAPERAVEVTTVVGVGLLPLFALIIGLTALGIWPRLYHPLCALANLLAGFAALYLGHVILHNLTFLVSFITSVAFFAFFFLRLRLPVAALVISSYIFALALAVPSIPGATALDVVWVQAGSFVLTTIIILGGYLLERTSRRVYAQEIIIAAQKDEVEREHDRSERLLLNILPQEIAARLKDDEKTIADSMSGVSVLFSDIVGFTSMSSELSAEEVVAFLNDIFFLFDGLAERHGLEKIKTIGDAYMAVAGVPLSVEDHADRTAAMGLGMIAAMAEYNQEQGTDIQVRIGIHSGPVVAGVIGKKKFMYDLWGDTVNTASRMESNGVPGAVQVSESTRLMLGDDYSFIDRGLLTIKGKGEMRAFLLSK